VARQTETKHLVLTHLQPETTEEKLLNDAATHFTRRMTMAVDQMRLVV
jgi:ribonuclease BN (tRNA processing enzyme)